MLGAIFVCCSCSGNGESGTAGDAPSSPVTFAPSTAIIVNPERGFYTTADLAKDRDLQYVRVAQKSLVYAAAHLDAYLGTNHAQDLPPQALSDIEAGFLAVRQAGIKAVVRFQYDDGEGYPDGANDAPESWIIRHIQQLAPVLKRNEDVIFVVQAGFIGAWGEWHTSQNFSDGPSSAGARKNVIDALLAALPGTRRTAIRYPAYKRMFYGTTATTEAQLLAGADVARVGHFNDCFVSGPDDVGTYQYEPMDVLKDYLAVDTKYVPIGGETCAVDPRNSCATTTAEMERFHWTYINDDFDENVLATWQREGCRPEIERKLGYRLALLSGALPQSARPGGSFTLDLTLVNEGWAAPTHPRPVFVVLDGQDRRWLAELPVDVRTWLPGQLRLVTRLRLPAALVTGMYRLALFLPDAATGLRGRPEYSVQLANEAIFSSANGDNTLGPLIIAADAPGSADGSAPSFEVIP